MPGKTAPVKRCFQGQPLFSEFSQLAHTGGKNVSVLDNTGGINRPGHSKNCGNQ
jgi:hypothetical protein